MAQPPKPTKGQSIMFGIILLAFMVYSSWAWWGLLF